ncbi:alpha/beta hydrolase family protein [Acidianus brierleyi]|uniref:Dipeptidyl aminopeptidase n=1 Tax=Acidianus brierleyi TaxID=41673 RepID=A0A2U9IC29_9CREN|nr:prolyl oligopeptidase family serine peptidase [Acidianus brierleyi]AWR93567.1 prolyl oligopeptidase family serine peptidase [Acidianus brierleyi]
MRILVLHGKGSSPDKIKWLSKPLEEFGEIIVPDFDYEVKEGVEKALKYDFDCIAGHSRGGTIALMSSALTGKCCIAVSAPSDRVEQMKYLSSFPQDSIQYRNYLDLSKISIEDLKKYSPINYADKLHNVLLIHGKNDNIVSPTHSINLCNKIKENGGKCELYLIEMKHSPPMDKYSELAGIIKKWVKTQIY